jgi:hypothetical protein
MPTVFGDREAKPLGGEILQNVMEAVYARAAMPRHHPAAERDTAWGSDPKKGLHWDAATRTLRWPSKATPRKALVLAPDLGALTVRRRAFLAAAKVLCAGVTREIVRGTTRYFALLVLDGLPFRDPAYLETVQSGAHRWLTVDPNVGHLAYVAGPAGELPDAAGAIPLARPEEVADRAAEQRRIRRAQRQLDRSDRATNPDCYHPDGRAKKGATREHSTRYTCVLNRLRTSRRKQTIHHEQDRTDAARGLLHEGHGVGVELASYTGWQASRHGKAMGLTAPGALQARVEREAAIVGAAVAELSARTAASQLCLCGAKVKKPLSLRVHRCRSCGLGMDKPLDRDRFAAFVLHEARRRGFDLLGTSSIEAFHASLAAAECPSGVRERAVLLCSVHGPSLAGRSRRAAAVLPQAGPASPSSTGGTRLARERHARPDPRGRAPSETAGDPAGTVRRALVGGTAPPPAADGRAPPGVQLFHHL